MKSEVLGVLRAMFPDVTVPRPTAFFFLRWSSNPLCRRRYGIWPSGFVLQQYIKFRANLGRLWFSGEALSEKYFGICFLRVFKGIFMARLTEAETQARVAQCFTGRGQTSRPHKSEVYNSAPYDMFFFMFWMTSYLARLCPSRPVPRYHVCI